MSVSKAGAQNQKSRRGRPATGQPRQQKLVDSVRDFPDGPTMTRLDAQFLENADFYQLGEEYLLLALDTVGNHVENLSGLL